MKIIFVMIKNSQHWIIQGLGLFESIGHVDFFPNGGSNQPGCTQGMMEYLNAKQGSILQSLRQFLGCNHLRAYEYFTESISPPCPFLSIQCESYQVKIKRNILNFSSKAEISIKFTYLL